MAFSGGVLQALEVQLEQFAVAPADWAHAPGEAQAALREAQAVCGSAELVRHPSWGWAVIWRRPNYCGIAWMERWPLPMAVTG